MKKSKFVATSVALSLSLSAISPALTSEAATTSAEKQSSNASVNANFYQKYIEYLKSNPNAINDPEFTKELVSKVEAADSSNKSGQYETQGKITMTAKAGAKAIKVAMKKIGKAKWNNWIDSMEKYYGLPMSYLHYQGITNFVDIVSNSDDTFKEAISKYLRSKGMNRFTASIITNIFVSVVL